MEDARRDVAEWAAAAEREATEAATRARVEAERLLAEARAAGEGEARASAAAELARARRAGRERVLAARREAYDDVRAEARRAAADLAAGPDYHELLDGLAGLARARLGRDANVVVDTEAGGIVARAGERSVDYRLNVVADLAVAALGPEVDELWR